MLVGSVDEMNAAARDFVDGLTPNNARATVVGLRGELGGGKTTFAQGVAKTLGISDTVTSPTFVIMKRYKIPTGGFTDLVHTDAYRLEDRQEFLDLGWEKLCKDPRTLIFVEWPERVEGLLPTGTTIIDFTFVDETTRRLTFPDE